MTLTIGSLFAGIGGLELGLELAGLGPVVWQVEKDEKCRAVLAKHWPNVERHGDICGVGSANLRRVDLICGGFPCQDVSSAGKRVGLSGARSGLWFEFRRVVSELLPNWVVVENVASGASRWVDAIRESLEQLGYASLPVPLSASDCGAPHRRARVFIVGTLADFAGERREQGLQNAHARSIADAARSAGGAATAHDQEREQHGPPCASADAHGKQLRQQSGRRESGPQAAVAASPGADANHDTGVVHGQSRCRIHDAKRHGGWSAEPEMARVVHGLPGRVDRERMLGNAVVPAQAEVIGHVIQQLRGV